MVIPALQEGKLLLIPMAERVLTVVGRSQARILLKWIVLLHTQLVTLLKIWLLPVYAMKCWCKWPMRLA